MSLYPTETIGNLEALGAINAIQDGNHGEKHPKANDYVSNGIPFIMANNLKNGIVDLTGSNKISENQASQLRIGFSVKDDVLLTHKGTVGNVAIVPDIKPYIMLTPQVTYYRTNGKSLHNIYLKYAFCEPMFQARLHSVSMQATRPYIGIRAQRNLSFFRHSTQDCLHPLHLRRPHRKQQPPDSPP
jgi:type I restriction enzyme S subunit